MDEMAPAMSKMSSSSSSAAATAAAAAVVAAAAASAAASSSGSILQLVGVDYPSSSKEGLGLGLSSSSPAIEALAVARASSYVPLEEQKELGIDYSLFTRVETAGWRILIPPNVTASFRSEDFGLLLKPKGGAEEEVEEESKNGLEQESEERDAKAIEVSEASRENGGEEKVMRVMVQTEASMEESSPVGGYKELPVSFAVVGDVVAPTGSAEGMEIEEEMDELEDD